MNRNHQNLVKFDSSTDNDFLTIIAFLKQIAKVSPEKIGKTWKDHDRLHKREYHR